MQDSTHILQEQVQQAVTDNTQLIICGGASKRFYGRQSEGERLSTLIHTGIISYEPTELVLTARAGTPLSEINSALAGNKQMLACEPPSFSDQATFGGMIAAGLSGPARPFCGSVQDMILGCTLLNGRGEVLRFGGKVMKNVAGYDVSRLMAGSLGCLGVLLDITVKVVPAPAAEYSCKFSMPGTRSVEFINNLQYQGYPVSAATQSGDELTVRFSAGKREVDSVPDMLDRQYGFIQRMPLIETDFWIQLKEQLSPHFTDGEPLWRLSIPADRSLDTYLGPDESVLTEWGGALHWVKTRKSPQELFQMADSLNGHATFFRQPKGEETGPVFQPLGKQQMLWHHRLKEAFDPRKLFNKGRMYAEI